MLRALAALLLFTQSLSAPTIAWDASPGARGYNVFWGTEPHAYTFVRDVGNSLTNHIAGLEPDTTYYFAVNAYNATGESDLSDEITFTEPFTTNAVLTVDLAGSPLGPWTNLVTLTNMVGWQGFYRVNLNIYTNSR